MENDAKEYEVENEPRRGMGVGLLQQAVGHVGHRTLTRSFSTTVVHDECQDYALHTI